MLELTIIVSIDTIPERDYGAALASSQAAAAVLLSRHTITRKYHDVISSYLLERGVVWRRQRGAASLGNWTDVEAGPTGM